MPKIGSQITPRPPTRDTLRRYGLTEQDWSAICDRQQCLCPVCSEPFGDRPLAIDHEHVRGFKARKTRKGQRVRVMPQSERAAHVRGVLHSFCNRFVRRWLTLERAASILKYLQDHERRRA